jgi:hypothetical protein
LGAGSVPTHGTSVHIKKTAFVADAATNFRERTAPASLDVINDGAVVNGNYMVL